MAATLPLPPRAKLAASVEEKRQVEAVVDQIRNSHLRSCREVIRYEIHGSDGKAGTLDDLLIDPDESRIRFLVIKTNDWLSHRQVIIRLTGLPAWAGPNRS